MSERYIKVFAGGNNLYADNAPVVIPASALLKDSVTGKMIAQLKILNMSGKTISYVKVGITPLDAVGNPLGDVLTFEYLVLQCWIKRSLALRSRFPLPIRPHVRSA